MAQSSGARDSLKRLGVNKTNTRILIVTSAATFLVVFFLIASYSMFGTLMYKNRVIKEKKTAVAQLKKNLAARDSLVDSYKKFVTAPQNIIYGSPTGDGPRDGTNGKLVLDALPSKYDFPATSTSLEKLATDQRLSIKSITGTDDEVAQSTHGEVAATPKPVEMPFEFQVQGDYPAVQRMISALDHSIRPIQIQKMTISGDEAELTLNVKIKTFYQPESTALINTTKVVK